jgi:tRNA(Ile2) C34 agmatinyltransferase TiaS
MLKPITAPPRPQPAPRCPSCGTLTGETASKNVNASTYWRCTRCGEIWNAARLESRSDSFYRR